MNNKVLLKLDKPFKIAVNGHKVTTFDVGEHIVDIEIAKKAKEMEIGNFQEIIEKKIKTPIETKAGDIDIEALRKEATELNLEFAYNLGAKKLKIKIEEEKARLELEGDK